MWTTAGSHALHFGVCSSLVGYSVRVRVPINVCTATRCSLLYQALAASADQLMRAQQLPLWGCRSKSALKHDGQANLCLTRDSMRLQMSGSTTNRRKTMARNATMLSEGGRQLGHHFGKNHQLKYLCKCTCVPQVARNLLQDAKCWCCSSIQKADCCLTLQCTEYSCMAQTRALCHVHAMIWHA